MDKETKKYLTIGIIVTSVITAFFLKNAISSAVKSLGNKLGYADDKRATKKELKDLESKGLRPSYSPSWYKDKVSSILAQAEGCGKYNDVLIVDIITKLNNEVDYLELKKEFGFKKWDGCNWEGNFGNDEGNLPYLLTSELSTGNIDLINEHFKNKGINYLI